MRQEHIHRICLWLFVFGLIFGSAELKAEHSESDIRVGLLLYSNHPFADEDYDHNEEHEGIYFSYNGWLLGTYTNSYDKQSTLIGYETQLGKWHDIEFSVLAALADNYPEKGEDIGQDRTKGPGTLNGGYQPWASLNIKYKWLKVWYGYVAVGAGLEWQLDL